MRTRRIKGGQVLGNYHSFRRILAFWRKLEPVGILLLENFVRFLMLNIDGSDSGRDWLVLGEFQEVLGARRLSNFLVVLCN